MKSPEAGVQSAMEGPGVELWMWSDVGVRASPEGTSPLKAN